MGLLRILVVRGTNLAVRDFRTSDPYVVIHCASQKLKTRVEKDNCNPVWNEELTILIRDINTPITVSVYDHDTFSRDDSMGNAKIDIKRFVECVNMGWQDKDVPDCSEVARVKASKDNCLSKDSCVVWSKGKMVQDMILGLEDVECGELHLRIEWIHLPSDD